MTQFYNQTTNEYTLVREENNGVYFGDIFYTLEDLTDDRGVMLELEVNDQTVLDANEQPVFVINWDEETIRAYVVDDGPTLDEQIYDYNPETDIGFAIFFGIVYEVHDVSSAATQSRNGVGRVPFIVESGEEVGWVDHTGRPHFY